MNRAIGPSPEALNEGFASLRLWSELRPEFVKADKHFVHDVIAGAVIGEGAGWLLTSKKDEKVQWLPWADAHGAGLAVATHF